MHQIGLNRQLQDQDHPQTRSSLSCGKTQNNFQKNFSDKLSKCELKKFQHVQKSVIFLSITFPNVSLVVTKFSQNWDDCYLLKWRSFSKFSTDSVGYRMANDSQISHTETSWLQGKCQHELFNNIVQHTYFKFEEL